MATILITGSSRGLGLELTRQYAHAGWHVFATCRQPTDAAALQSIAATYSNVSLHRLDVTACDDIRALSQEIGETPLDVIFNNAGEYLQPDSPSPDPEPVRHEDWLKTLEINALGAARVSEALLDNVSRSTRRLIAIMTSHLGNIADMDAECGHYYQSSKSALTTAMRSFAVALRPFNIGVLLLHPGSIATGSGPPEKNNPCHVVQTLRELVDEFTLDLTGSFYLADGTPIEW